MTGPVRQRIFVFREHRKNHFRQKERKGAQSLEERQLIQQAQAGNRAAVEELLGRYEEQVYRLVARFFPSPADAGDVAQDVMIRIFHRLTAFNWRSAFSTWVYRVTVNACIDEGRRRRKREQPGLPEHIEAPGDGPEEQAVRGETRRQVREAVARLSPEHRAILLLREVEDLDYGEIAVILGVAAGTVKSRLCRARESFRRQYEQVVERGEGHAVRTDRPSLLNVARR